MGVSDQGQKGGLQRVLGFAGATENPAAHTQNHRPVPPDENLKGRPVAVLGKAADQFAVGEMSQAVAGGTRPRR